MVGSIFVGWLLKWLVLKYGGIRLHRKAVPFFLGIVLGEFVIGSFWSLLLLSSINRCIVFYFNGCLLSTVSNHLLIAIKGVAIFFCLWYNI